MKASATSSALVSRPPRAALAAMERASIKATADVWPWPGLLPSRLGKFRVCLLYTSTKTVLLISHRLANVVDADCIYVLDKGQVAESGPHQELLERGGAYRRLWDAQAALEHYGEEAIR